MLFLLLFLFWFNTTSNPKMQLPKHIQKDTDILPNTSKYTFWFCVLTHEKLFCVFFCLRVFRSRFADFQHNCQPSPLSASGCMRESRAMCLKAYAGLIGEMEKNKLDRKRRLKVWIIERKIWIVISRRLISDIWLIWFSSCCSKFDRGSVTCQKLLLQGSSQSHFKTFSSRSVQKLFFQPLH